MIHLNLFVGSCSFRRYQDNCFIICSFQMARGGGTKCPPPSSYVSQKPIQDRVKGINRQNMWKFFKLIFFQGNLSKKWPRNVFFWNGKFWGKTVKNRDFRPFFEKMNWKCSKNICRLIINLGLTKFCYTNCFTFMLYAFPILRSTHSQCNYGLTLKGTKSADPNWLFHQSSIIK